MKRLILLFLAAVVALSGCSGTGGSTAAAQNPVIGLTYIPNIQFSPFYVAEADGAFTTAGVSPTLRHHGTSESLFTAIASGQEQFVVAGGDEMLQARSQGLDLIAVGAYYHSYPAEVIVPKASTITTLAGLKGHSIGIPGKYGESWFALLVALDSAGLTQADVTIKEIGYTQTTALSTGKVDAVIGFSNNDAVQFGLAGFSIRSLAIAPGTVPLVPASLITTSSYAKDHPEVVKAVVAAMTAGINTVITNPSHAMDVSANYIPDLKSQAATASAQATLTATIPLWKAASGSVDARMSAAQWAAMADFLAQTKLTATRQDPALAMTNDYV